MTQAEVLAQWEARENDRRDCLPCRTGEPTELGKKLLLKQITSLRRRRRFHWYEPSPEIMDDQRTKWRDKQRKWYRSKRAK